MEGGTVELIEDIFDDYLHPSTGVKIPIKRFTWRNKNDFVVQVITYGATITSIKIPDHHGSLTDIVMGFDNMEGYLSSLNPYFGATVGRVANRIKGGIFKIDDETYHVSKNADNNTLHGGFKGFDKVVWEYDIQGESVVFSYLSINGEEGFPGDLIVNIKCQLTNDNKFIMNMKAYTNKPTIVNLTNHSYFNLAGHGAGAEELYNHSIQINADKYTQVDDEAIPTGKFISVAGTAFDFRSLKVLKDVLPKEGYDHNFCMNTESKQINFIASASHGKHILKIYSNQPGVQFYTANFLPKLGDNQLIGKDNCVYNRQGSFCFETQNYPDAINHDNFPIEVLRPGEVYNNLTYLELS